MEGKTQAKTSSSVMDVNVSKTREFYKKKVIEIELIKETFEGMASTLK